MSAKLERVIVHLFLFVMGLKVSLLVKDVALLFSFSTFWNKQITRS